MILVIGYVTKSVPGAVALPFFPMLTLLGQCSVCAECAGNVGTRSDVVLNMCGFMRYWMVSNKTWCFLFESVWFMRLSYCYYYVLSNSCILCIMQRQRMQRYNNVFLLYHMGIRKDVSDISSIIRKMLCNKYEIKMDSLSNINYPFQMVFTQYF